MIALRTVLAAGAALLIGTATLGATQASAAVINGSDFTNGQSAQTIGGINFVAAPDGRTFQQKTLGTPTYTGVGLSGGATGDEIDIGEFLTGTAVSGGFGVTSFRIGVLFDGPEFGDVNEIARVTVTTLTNVVFQAILTSTGETSATWSGSGAVSNLSPANDAGGAVWEVSNPFAGILNIKSIEFTALTGVCGTAGGACTNQSDFTVVQLVTSDVAVPEPATLALLGAGLLGLGLARRRRG